MRGERVMTSEALDHELNREPFRPLRLHLADGSAVDVATPYLSFINRRALYVAQASQGEGESRVALIPLGDIVDVVRPASAAPPQA
jgi:hypothetical protein